MALDLGQVTVGGTAVTVLRVPPGPFTLELVASGTAVAVGTSTLVTVSTGALVGTTSTVTYAGYPTSSGATLYAISSGAATLSYHLCTDE